MSSEAFTIVSKERFDDVGDPDEARYVDYAYHGYNYIVSSAEMVFHVRSYDDEPGIVTVMAPASAHGMHSAKPLVSFLLSALGASAVQFYDGENGIYRKVDPETLAFYGWA